jgi:DNA-binding CsgD family transcriptional regulator
MVATPVAEFILSRELVNSRRLERSSGMAEDRRASGLTDSPTSVLALPGARRRLRAEIGASWDRSARSGLSREKFQIPHQTDFDASGPIVNLARPVLRELSDELATYGVGVVLTNEKGQVLDRHAPDASLRRRLDAIMLAPGSVYAENLVGTNAIGTALEQGRPSVVDGQEHFAEKLTNMMCAAHPIIDPRSGQSVGIVDLSCATHQGSPLMLPLVRRAAKDIEQRLLGHLTNAERILLGSFTREDRAGNGPLICISDQLMITNDAAKQIVGIDEESVIWDSVSPMLSDTHPPKELVLKSGTFAVLRCDPIMDGGDVVGAALQLGSLRSAPRETSHSSQNGHTAFGWRSLTGTELNVIDLVSQGLTNRGVAERLFMSPYTVDSHLRSIYRKLGVNSRVDLTRVALMHEYE